MIDFNANAVGRIVIASGVVTSLAGNASSAVSVDGTGASANFANPSGTTLLGANLYVTDSYNNLVRKIVIATGAVTTVAGTARVTGSANGSGAAAG